MHSPCQAITAGSSKRHFEQMFELSPGRLEFRLESFEKCFELQSAIFQKLSELFSSSPYATFYSKRQQKLVNTFKSLPEHREERSLNSASSELEKCNKLCVCVCRKELINRMIIGRLNGQKRFSKLVRLSLIAVEFVGSLIKSLGLKSAFERLKKQFYQKKIQLTWRISKLFANNLSCIREISPMLAESLPVDYTPFS